MIKEKCRQCGKRLNNIIIIVCLALCVFKFFVGYIGKSHALMAAAFYSLQYVIVAVMVSWGVGFSSRKPNEKYPYGYGKLEYVVTSAISMFIIASMLIMLFVVGTKFLFGPSKPTMFAVWGAVISLFTTYILSGYLECAGKNLKSPAIISNARHLNMDSISSLCLIAAIILTMNGMRHLDSFVAIVEAIHIIYTSAGLFSRGIKGLMDSSLPDSQTARIKRAILNIQAVKGIGYLRTREMGNENQVDCEIQLEGEVALGRADAIKEEIRHSIETLLKTPVMMNISIIPLEMSHSNEKWMTSRIAKVLRKYYSNFIESHRIALGEQTIDLALSFLPGQSSLTCETVKGRITDDLQREIPGTKITVTIVHEKFSTQKEVAYV